MKIAVESWEAYNKGILACKWFDTEIDSIEDIEEFFKQLHKKYNLSNDLELFIADYKDETGMYKGDNLFEAYEITEAISDLDEYDLKKISFIIKDNYINWRSAIDKIKVCELYEGTNLSDLAYYFVENGLFGEISDKIKCYIDYDAIARDLKNEGYIEHNGDVFIYN